MRLQKTKCEGDLPDVRRSPNLNESGMRRQHRAQKEYEYTPSDFEELDETMSFYCEILEKL